MKKMLVLMASPRKGNIFSKAGEVAKAYEKKGYEVEFVDVCKLSFHDCIGCMKCRSSGNCIFHDDASAVGKKMTEADVIAVASPVWWGNMPGHLKAFFDRNVYNMMGESRFGIPVPLMKGKKGILISSCTTPFPFNWICGQTSGLKHAVKEIFKSSGIKLVKTISIAGTKTK